MTDQTQEKSAYLFLREGSSDKEYHLHLRSVAGGWTAYFANGPRGRVGSSKPIKEGVFTLEQASKHYEDKLKSKLKGGYTPSQDGVRFSNTEEGKRASGHVQQLPTAITKDVAECLLSDNDYAAQEKANGERRAIEVKNGQVRGINKLGLYVNLPENLVESLACHPDALFDGEQVGTTFYIFDLLRYDGHDIRLKSFQRRYDDLEIFLRRNVGDPSVKLLKAAFSTTGKQALIEKVSCDSGEGLVFKRVESGYEGGRTTAALKYKFCESSTCMVVAVNQQRSVRLGLLNAAGQTVPVGNVTIPANFPVPSEGDLVEVQYLYYNPEGAFEQPVYLGPRNDILPEEATLAQVTRFKPGVGMDEMGRRVDLKMGRWVYFGDCPQNSDVAAAERPVFR